MSISSWLNQDKYITLIKEKTQIADVSDISLVVARNFDEWKNADSLVKPWNQSLHLAAPAQIADKTLQTIFFGNDLRMVPTVTLDRESDGAFKELSIKAFGLTALDRSVLEVIQLYTHERNVLDLRMLVAEPYSQLSLQIRGRYPFAVTSGFIPDNPESLFPLPHIDLQQISFPDNSLDVLLSIEVFEHLTRYKKALAEAYRVLRKGGVNIFTCPFYCNSRETIIKAIYNDDGSIQHLTPPEYHGDPLRPTDGILVFQIPGWDLLSEILNAGFSDAAVCFLSSPQGGIIGKHFTGCFVFICEK